MKNYKLLTPGPLTTTDTVKEQMLFDHCTWDDDYKKITLEIRDKLLELAHVSEPEYTVVLMQGSGTFGVESVITSTVGSDEKLLIAANGSYGRRMADIAEHAGINYRLYEVNYNEIPDAKRIAEILEEDPEVTHVSMVHSETTSGILNDIASVSKVVKAAGRTMIVDAMSSFGGVDIPVGELGIDFIQGYGLTETSPIIALNPKEHFKIESVGKFFAPYMEMKILEPNEDGIGEVAVKGPMVMQGYYQMPEATAEVFTEDGWFKTGDLGRLDNENYLYLAGRAKNMIVTEGGKNVYPEEIENQFQLYTDIEQITVQGYIIDTATKSEGIEALVYPSDDLYKKLKIMRDDPTQKTQVQEAIEQIIAEVNKKLQPYARISRTTILDAPLEMTTTKKVKRTYTK